MQKACCDLAAHALAERELFDRLVQYVGKAKTLGQFVSPPAKDVGVLIVYPAQQRKCIPRRQFIPKLRALAEDHADAISKGAALTPWRQAKHFGGTGGGLQYA